MATNGGDDVSSAEGALYKSKMALGSMVRQRPLDPGAAGKPTPGIHCGPRDRFLGRRCGRPVTLQAWDQCERLIDDFRRSFRIESNDGDAPRPDRITFRAQRRSHDG
ncbi:hypothetical protein [Halorhabdus rudnickae]|uniref:hypothetical protein n=1 Tax=Halorhabdus rudnickae TaxID=1775544 RepID=UPI00108233F2|nr:hypothetical protein [Halorhabdus rudnickae]